MGMEDGATARQPAMARPHVIACETDEMLQTVLLELFTDEGMDVTMCSSGEEVEQTLEREPQAVIVTELWDESPIQVAATDCERLERLAKKTHVIVTTARQ